LDVRNLLWLTDQVFHFHQSTCVLALISVGFFYVLSVSPGIDGSLRLIWDLPGKCPGILKAVRLNVDVPKPVALFYILHYKSPNDI